MRDANGAGNAGADYQARLNAAFNDFPDDLKTMREEGLGFFRYALTDKGRAANQDALGAKPLHALVDEGWLEAEPITYEDFLPVSAAGIFQSNLGADEQKSYAANSAQAVFEAALGATVQDEIALYEEAQARSLKEAVPFLSAH